MTRMHAALTTALLVAAGAFWWTVGGAPEKPVNPAAARAVQSSAAAHALVATAPSAPRFITGLENLPPSLAGTDVNDGLRVDAHGHLVVDDAVRALFDYFLATVGEEPFATVAARLHAYLVHRLAEPARGEALALLASYLGFWQEAGQLSQEAGQAPDSDQPAAMAAFLDRMHALRSRWFGADVDAAFFGAQDAYNQYTLQRRELLQDPSLDDVTRAQELADLLQQLPGDMQDALRTATTVQTLDDLTAACRRRGCSAGELQQVRSTLVGPEAAQRLADLDRAQAAFQARLANYFLQRDRILSNPAYSPDDRQAQLATLQDSLFSDNDRLRLPALERIHDGTTAQTAE